ncbi:MAG TPA: zf-HC2 domain-containing protein [Bryobacteraceae bacterium]|nr:zf-HC2 domain-containing protein [Bryobacteraceae bacterium]
MSGRECSPEKLKDYVLSELSQPERAEVEAHAEACAECRAELDTLGLTRAMLLAIPDEEPPRRIAFVSDKVFEPRWYQRLWASGPQLGFASAAMLAGAIMVHGWQVRPATVTQAAVTAPAPTVSAAAVEAEIEKRVRTEVAKAVAANEQKQLARTLELVNSRLANVESRRREELLVVRDMLERVDQSSKSSLMRNAGLYQ